MSNFLTVEDVNSVVYSNQGFYWVEIDTSKITDTNEEYSAVKYDFVEIYRFKLNNGKYRFSIIPHCDLWANGVAILKTDGSLAVDTEYYVFGNSVNFITPYQNLKLMMYMGNIPLQTRATLLNGYLIKNVINLNLKELNSVQNIKCGVWGDDEIVIYQEEVSEGYNLIENNQISAGYLLVNLIKTNFQFTCNQSLVVGKINKVYLGTDSDYLPSGDMVGSYAPKITVSYNDLTLPVSYDETANDYYFNLDLTDKTETGKIRFKVNVESNEVLNNTSTDVVLNSQYETVSTFANLVTACNSNGAEIIRLGADLTATSDIPIQHSVKILGNDKTLNLNGHGFELNEGLQFKAEDLNFTNGDTVFKQSKNTVLDLTDCTFTGCVSTEYNGLGSCILCDIDYTSLSVEDDYITNLTGCIFTNNKSAILHGGKLNINKCKFHNNDVNVVNKDNTAFIYQVDGDATILNSVFDIDYTSIALCTNETNIGYAQTIFTCGENATVNGLNYTDLKADNFNSFFENPQKNQSHIFAKYYYPQIETCVFTSPTLNDENKSLCYSLSGDDWIHKVNAQVTRASAGTENTNRKITW